MQRYNWKRRWSVCRLHITIWQTSFRFESGVGIDRRIKNTTTKNNKTHRELQFALCAKSERTLTPSIRCGIFLARCNFCFSFLFFFGSTVQWFSFRIPRAAPPNEMFLFSLVLVLDSFFSFCTCLVRYMVFTCCFLSNQLTTDRDWKF